MVKASTCLPPVPSPTPAQEKDMCSICQKEVQTNDKAIECNKCKHWVHTKCNKITNKQYKHYQNNPEEIFECKECNKCNVCRNCCNKPQSD